MKKIIMFSLLAFVLVGGIFFMQMNEDKDIKVQDCNFENTHFQFISGDVVSAVEGLENAPNFKGYKLSDYGGCN